MKAMKIKDIKIKSVEKGSIFRYIDNENTKVKEAKIKGKIIPENSGYYLITGKIRIHDGSVYPAILGISSDDVGEMFEAYFFINGEWISQMDKQLLKKIDKKKTQVFPYTYQLNVKVEGDKHILHQF